MWTNKPGSDGQDGYRQVNVAIHDCLRELFFDGLQPTDVWGGGVCVCVCVGKECGGNIHPSSFKHTEAIARLITS